MPPEKLPVRAVVAHEAGQRLVRVEQRELPATLSSLHVERAFGETLGYRSTMRSRCDDDDGFTRAQPHAYVVGHGLAQELVVVVELHQVRRPSCAQHMATANLRRFDGGTGSDPAAAVGEGGVRCGHSRSVMPVDAAAK